MLNKEILRSKWKEFKLSAYLLNRNLLTRISMIVLLLLILSAIFAPMLSPYPEDAINATHPEIALQAPSAAHIFGTDELGRDILSKTIYGIRISLSSALITVFFAMVVGTLLGAIAGSVGGILDEIIMRITDVFLSFPSLLLAIVIAAFLGPSLEHAQMAMVISWWPWYTRIMRGEAISIKERQYIKAADTIGTPRLISIFKHIIPNGLSPIIIQASQDMGAVVLTVASLGFLGLGAQPPTPEWGLMVSTSKSYFMNAWWYTVYPGAAIFITVLVFNVIGDGLREVLDPKTRKI
jgi:peptide/nickel transport system permease protein